MITALSILLFGFLLGMRHATDADHVVAVTTIVSRERSIRHAALIGALWGIGHTLTVLLAGGLILSLGIVVSRRAGLFFELSVALMLIVLGIANLRGLVQWANDLFRNRTRAAARAENHAGLTESSRAGLKSLYILRPLIVGIVHGLAGSAALALLVLPIIDKPGLAVAYLLFFGTGTIAGMMLITAGIALPLASTVKFSEAIRRRIAVGSGLLSTGFGLFLVYQIGFVEGLFIK